MLSLPFALAGVAAEFGVVMLVYLAPVQLRGSRLRSACPSPLMSIMLDRQNVKNWPAVLPV